MRMNMAATRSFAWSILLILSITQVQAFVRPSISAPSPGLQHARLPTARYASEELDFGNVMDKIQVVDFDGISASVKSIDIANIDVNSLSDSPAILAAVALAIIGVGSAAAAGGGSGYAASDPPGTVTNSKVAAPKEKVKGPDLSIPYDAAARSAYDVWCTTNEEKFNADGFVYFQELFHAKAAAEAAAKKRARDLNMFQNKGRPEVPPRKIKPKLQEEVPLYFASEQS